MKQASRLLKGRHVNHREITVDPSMIARIAADMREHGGAYMPRGNWVSLDAAEHATEVGEIIPEAFSEEAIRDRMANSEQLLDVWIGSGQMEPALSSVAKYRPFLEPHDPLGLWAANVLDQEVAAKLFDADLGSILDLNFFHSFAPKRSRTRILEVGGGYGRTAEAALNIFAGSVTWVMLDVVPASLAYAAAYLRRACPGASIGFYYDDDPFDLDTYDCYVAPAWRFEELSGDARYDACVNVESFQEMTQSAVDAYLDLFDRVAAEEAMVYLSNAHDYVFKGDWNYPAGWRRLLCANTPRSWTRDHPTEVFVKAAGDHGAVNAALETAYRYTLPSL